MAEECVLSLQKSLTQLEGKKSGRMSGINVEEYLMMMILWLFEGVAEEDNSFRLRFLSEIPDEMENDDEKDDDDDDTDTQQYLSTSIQGSRQWETRSGMLRHPTYVGEHFCTPFKQRGIQLIDK
ncbi:hypothetical protein AVEN_214690-1 [Araneus ventricosus]|uniref:Uncharacterized protein n=1 Tax=Araneus ventricosus TaxID=182803 RepID=A0A4Y2W755_ARAVE|nr:hypothetical protein AVEN_125759-1 [Araneus ventricosus]GBO32357.1 hypothetical protein AVEN_214690-1 [Araneus ventricosus]